MKNMEIMEIEVRFIVDEAKVNALRETLKASGKKSTIKVQEDIYFNGLTRDLIQSEECLRVRTVDGRAEITWKPPTTAAMKHANEFWKQEVDLNVAEQGQIAVQLLRCIGYQEYCIVKKTRESFFDNERCEVSLDHVENVGWFVEIEVKSSDLDYSRELLKKKVNELDLEKFQLNKVPYRDLVEKLGS